MHCPKHNGLALGLNPAVGGAVQSMTVTSSEYESLEDALLIVKVTKYVPGVAQVVVADTNEAEVAGTAPGKFHDAEVKGPPVLVLVNVTCNGGSPVCGEAVNPAIGLFTVIVT